MPYDKVKLMDKVAMLRCVFMMQSSAYIFSNFTIYLIYYYTMMLSILCTCISLKTKDSLDTSAPGLPAQILQYATPNPGLAQTVNNNARFACKTLL